MKQSNKTKLNMENKADKRLSSFKMPDLNLIPHWLKMGDPKIHEDLGRVLTLVDIPKVGNVQEMNDLYKHRGSKTTFFSSVSSISNGNIANNGINNANKEINKPEQSVKLNMDYSIMAQSAVYDDNVSKSVKSVPVNKSALSSKFVHNHNGKQSNNSSPITSVDIPSSSTSKGCVEQPNLNRLKISTTEAILVCQAIKIEDRVSRNKSATRIFRPVRQMISQDDATYVCQAIKIPDSSVNNFPSVSTSQNDVQKKDFHQDQIITNTMTVSATASIDSKCVSSQAIQPRTCHDSITTRRKGRKLQPPKRLILGLVGPAEPSLYERRMMSATKLTKSMYESYLGRPVDNDDDDDEERFFLGVRK